MRILVLLTDLFDAVGGIQTFNRALVKALDEIAGERDWEVTLLVLNDQAESKDAGRYYDSKITRCQCFARSKTAFVGAALRESLNASKVIMGHVHFSPLAVSMRIIHPKIEQILCVFGIEVWKRLSLFQLLGAKCIDRFISISASTRDQMLSYNNLNGKRFDILPCTLDPHYDHESNPLSREELSLPSGRMILTVSRLNPSERYKGVDKLIEAMPAVLREIPDAFLTIVGDGADRPNLERLAKEVGVNDKVFFAGHVPEDRLPSYYRTCDVFALPSLMEGFGIVFLEAMYFAKPCIGARAGAVPEVIEDGKTGFIVEPGNYQALTVSIIRLLRDASLLHQLGKAGMDYFKIKYAYLEFLNKLRAAVTGIPFTQIR